LNGFTELDENEVFHILLLGETDAGESALTKKALWTYLTHNSLEEAIDDPIPNRYFAPPSFTHTETVSGVKKTYEVNRPGTAGAFFVLSSPGYSPTILLSAREAT